MKERLIICLTLLAFFNFSFAEESPTSGGADGEMIINSTAKLAIVCYSEYIEVTVERKNYPGLDTNVTHLEDEACVPGYRDENKVVFRFGLEDCKTEQEEDKKVIHYKNKIVAMIKDEDKDGNITRSSTRVLPFQCSYKKKALVSKVRLNPRFTRVVTNAEDYGNFTYLVDIYTDKDYSTKVDEFPFKVGISQRLYLETSVQTSDSNLVLFPDECKATPSRDINAKPDHLIIEEACPRDESLEYEYKMSASQRFSLVAFRFKTGYDDVYIHCKLTVCLSDELESKCTKGCQDGENDSRKKREVKEDYGADLFIGPIKIKEEKDEAIDSPRKAGTQNSPQMFLLVGLLVGVLGVVALGLIAALIIVIKRRRPAENAKTLLIYDE